MPLPIERFKGAYANWRYNPFTDAYMTVDKTEDNLYIPASSPFLIQLLELPKKDTPSTVTVWCYDTSGYFTEVATAPAQGQFRVDYPPADGKGTGLIEFNQNDATKQVRIFYKATGSPVLEEFLNTKLSWPAGTPAERQIVAVVGSAPVWRDNPIRYFHEGNAVYHSSGEFESCVIFRFKKSSAEGKVLLELKGAKLHQAYYTELKSHDHGAGSLAGSQPAHTHPIGGSTDPGTPHIHPSVTLGASDSAVDLPPRHTHPLPANTGNGGNQAVTISGSVANAGVTAKTYPNALKVYVDGIDKTSQILTKAGMAALGDGTSSHAFVTTGTGEMDITDLIASDGFHELVISEPQNAGGRCLIHLELY